MQEIDPFPTNCEAKTQLDGMEIRLVSSREAIESGMTLLSNDRKATWLMLSQSIIANATMAGLRVLSFAGWWLPTRERTSAEQTTSLTRLRAANRDLEVNALSGGNQQRVAIAKRLLIRPRLLFDESTHGTDIAAIKEIYQLINQWTARGIAILLITSETIELLILSDRIAVMHRGQVRRNFPGNQAAKKRFCQQLWGQFHWSTHLIFKTDG